MSNRKAVLFVNGEAGDLTSLPLEPNDYLIAVDNGWRHLSALGLLPQLLIGDLDSLPASAQQAASEHAIETLRYPVEKDQTDLELALNVAVQRGFMRIMLACALGGRLDHTLGSLSLLARPDLAQKEVWMEDGLCEVRLTRGELSIATEPGDLVSLIPWQGDALGIHTEGLYYPLHNETLHIAATRGISNLALGASASLSVRSGTVLVIHYHQPRTEEGKFDE